MFCLFITALFFVAGTVSSTYIVTCHNDGECGTVCGRYSSDIVAPTEGIFSTSCKCGNGGGVTYKCTAFGVQVSECSDGIAPQCSTACGQKICIAKDGTFRNSKCCDNCFNVLKTFGIKTIWYSTDSGSLIKQKIGDIVPYIKH